MACRIYVGDTCRQVKREAKLVSGGFCGEEIPTYARPAGGRRLRAVDHTRSYVTTTRAYLYHDKPGLVPSQRVQSLYKRAASYVGFSKPSDYSKNHLIIFLFRGLSTGTTLPVGIFRSVPLSISISADAYLSRLLAINLPDWHRRTSSLEAARMRSDRAASSSSL